MCPPSGASSRLRPGLVVLLVFAGVAQAAPGSERGGVGLKPLLLSTGPTLDVRKSLAVTDAAITTQFTLRSVLAQLATQAGSGQTADALFRQLWDTQNPTGQPDLPAGAHCGGSLPNGAAYPCRPAEGLQAVAGPTVIQGPERYQAVGLYNRFDLAAADGSDCGQYRLVFAALAPRAFLIFEATLPNPRPALGLAGCRPVTDFWASLSQDSSVSSRGQKLKTFYFTGLPGFGPVIDLRNYGAGALGRGQIRANMFLGSPWFLREFKTSCTSSPCTLLFQPVTVQTNPSGGLFNAASSDPRAAAFQAFFPTQVATLAVADVNRFTYEVPDTFNAGGSDAQSVGVADDYLAQFASNPALRSAVQGQLTALGSTLTPEDIVARAQALSCGGCHERSRGAAMGGALTFPSSTSFVHSTEFSETGPDGPRFFISTALTGTFLPFRAQVLASFIGVDGATIDQPFPLLFGFNTQFTVQNTGTSSWTAASGYSLALTGAVNVSLPLTADEVVAPGQSRTFFLTLSPSAVGVPLHVTMVANGAPFGSPLDLTFFGWDSAAVDQPSGPMFAGMNVPVTVHNEGTTTWTGSAGYGLAVSGAFSVLVPLGWSDLVLPGQAKTFSVMIPASYPSGPMHLSMSLNGLDFGMTADAPLQCAPGAPGLWGAFTAGVTQLNWTPVSGASGYTLYRLANTTWAPIFTGSSTSYTDPGLAPGAYSYQVSPIGCSAGSTSNIATVCVPSSATQACGGQCGVTVPDGCGGQLACPVCKPTCRRVACNPRFCAGVCDPCQGCVE